MNAPINMAPVSELHAAALVIDTPLAGALWAIERGFYVFPCKPGTKKPAIGDNLRQASNDYGQVLGWAEQFDRCNWGAAPHHSGHVVFDLDRKNGKDGVAELERLALTNGEWNTDTLLVNTPSGGLHVWLAGSARTSRGEVAPGIDVRGGVGEHATGYVLLPGSVVDGNAYAIEHDAEIADAPEWLLSLANVKPAAAPVLEADPNADLHSDANRARAMDIIRRTPGAVEFQGSDDATYKLACSLMDHVTPELAIDLAWTHWVPRCVGSFDQDWFAAKFVSAGKNRQNAVGCCAVADAAVTFKDLIPQYTGQNADPKIPSRFVLRDWRDRQNTKPPVESVDTLLIEKGAVFIVGEKSAYKSFVALALAFAIASGRPAFGRFRVNRTGPVAYFAGEGAHGLETQRLPALHQDSGIPDDGTLPIFTIKGVPLAREDDEADAMAAAVTDRLGGVRPAMIVIDTLARSMGRLDENSAKDAGRFVDLAEALSERFDCLVLVVAHCGLNGEKRTRGSGAFDAGIDREWFASGNKKTLTVTLECMKDKDGPREDTKVYLRGEKIDLPGVEHGSLVFRAIDKPTAEPATRLTEQEVTEGDVATAAEKAVREAFARGTPWLNTEQLAERTLPRKAGQTDDDYDGAQTNECRRIERAVRYRSRAKDKRGEWVKGSLWTFVKKDDRGEPLTPYRFYLPEDMRGSGDLEEDFANGGQDD